MKLGGRQQGHRRSWREIVVGGFDKITLCKWMKFSKNKYKILFK